MRRANPSLRIFVLGAFVLLALASLVARLWYVQIARGSEYTAKLRQGSQVTVRIPAVRGEILDRNGIPLVQNRASFDVDFYLPDMVRAFRENHKGNEIPILTYRGTIHNMPADMKEVDIAKVVSSTIIPRMEELGVAEDFNTRILQTHYRYNSEVPFSYRQDVDFNTTAVFAEKNLGLPGVNITVKPVRQYVYGSLAAHLLGYVGMPNDLSTLSDINKFTFYDPDMEGKSQIELYMNDYLKGTPGKRILQKNVKGVIEGEDSVIEPKQGANVFLTIDARIQFIAERALRSIGRGACVVIDPNTGDILAMASVPSYDPNKFIPSIKAADWNVLNQDASNPLLNRAINSYAPGSTYKINTALAGLRAGVGNRTFNCSGGVTYGNTYMKCWIADKHGQHGMQNLETAIKNSCNAFFYQYGNAAGIDQIDAMGNMLGLGQKSGIPLSGESPGILPGPDYLAQISPNERWSAGYTANTSIGQGMVLATPLQMAMIASTVGNGGTCFYPRLIDKVVSQDGVVLQQEPAKVRTNLLTDAGLTPELIERARKGMWKVVNEEGGTGGKARIKGLEVAGKTGTAQNWTMRDGKRMKDNHVWFIAFVPYEHPKYAIAVLVQGAKSGGGVAAPIAEKILEESLALDSGDKSKEPQLAFLEPAVGNFNFVESIDYNRDVPAAMGADEEAPSVDSQSNSESQSTSNATARPNIREDADAGGRVQNQPRKPSGLEKFFKFFGGGGHNKQANPRPTPGRR